MSNTRSTIQMMPARGGLVNTGGQATAPEPSWWELRNVTLGSDGRMAKRPGLRQWAQTLKAPAAGGLGWQEIFSSMAHFATVTSGTTCTVTVGTGSVVFATTTTVESTDEATISRLAQPSDGSLTAGETGKMSLRFMFRARSPMPAQSGPSLAWGFGGGFKNETTVSVGFLILNDGIYLQNGTNFVKVAGTDVDDGSWHLIEIQQVSTVLTHIIIDDGTPILGAYQDSTVFDPAANQAILSVKANLNGLVDAEVALLQGRSGNDTIVGTPIRHLFEWSSANPVTSHMLVVAGDTVYDDRDWSGVLRPAMTTADGDLTLFAPFGEQLLILNPRQPTRLWTGDLGSVPTALPTNAPAGMYLATQHQGRCFAVREGKPLRVYASGANSLSDWTTEDLVSSTLQSFFFDVPDADGARITRLDGDYNGQLLIYTRKSVYTLVGSSIDTYVLRQISAKVGAEGPRAAARAAGDIVFLSEHGGHTVQTVQEYGDVSTKYVTARLRNLWQSDSFFDQRKVISNYRSSVVHAPHLGRTYLAVQTSEDTIPSRLYELNHDTNDWAGPWTVDCEAVAFMLVGNPSIPVMVFGDRNGRVSMAVDDRKMDFASDAYTMRLRSIRFDARSMDPVLIRRTKLWRMLRLYVVPRGGWTIDVTWTADGHDRQGVALPAPTQNVYKDALLGSTFLLGSSSIVDSERLGVMSIKLDARSRWLEFTIEQSGADEDLVVVGAELDFEVAQQDVEN